MPEDIWAELISQAQLRSACAVAECRVTFTVHGSRFCDLQHLAVGEHACVYCDVLPRHIISIHSLQTVRRELLLAGLIRWMDHLHSQDPAPVAPDAEPLTLLPLAA